MGPHSWINSIDSFLPLKIYHSNYIYLYYICRYTITVILLYYICMYTLLLTLTQSVIKESIWKDILMCNMIESSCPWRGLILNLFLLKG